MDKLGIENLKLILNLVLEVANVVDAIGRDTTPARWGNLFKLIDELASIGGIKMSQVVPEWKDLDDVEKADLKASFKEKFDIADEDLELTIEKGLDITLNAVAAVSEAVALIQTFGKKA